MRSLLSGALLLACPLLMAQQNSLYQAISYQAVARDANGDPLANQTIGLQFGISAGIGLIYQETQTATTNDQGLFKVNIGEGTPTGYGPLEEYPWYHPSNDISLLVSADLAGGTNYQPFGSEKIRAVPVAATARMATTLLDSSVVVQGGVVEVDPTYELRVNGSLTYQDGNEGAGKVLVSDADGTASWQDPQETAIYQVDNDPISTKPKSPDFIMELSAAWPAGDSKAIPASILEDYCADLDGCRLTLVAENSSGTLVPIKSLSMSYSVGSTEYHFNYGNNVNFLQFGGGDFLTSGASSGCRVTGESYSGFIPTNGDLNLHLGKLNPSVSRCSLKIED